MQEKVRVSVCILSWNHEAYISQCLASVFAQTASSIEIIYLDNASTDGSYATACSLLETSNLSFKVLRNEDVCGVAHNLNILLANTNGELIIPLSADDWLAPACVAARMEFYYQHPETGMIYSNGWNYYQKEDKLVLGDITKFKRGKVFKEILLEPGSIFFVGCCYPKSILLELGGWDENLLIEDLDMFIRIAEKYDISFIAEPLVYYRKFSQNLSANVTYMVKGWEQYYQKYKDIDWANMDTWLAEKYRSYAAISLDQGDLAAARQLIWKSLRLHPFQKKILGTIKYYILKKLRTPGSKD